MIPRPFLFLSHAIYNVLKPLYFSLSDACPPSPRGRICYLTGGPCLGVASCSAFLCLAFVQSNEAGWGVNGYGSFCQNLASISLLKWVVSQAEEKDHLVMYENTHVGGDPESGAERFNKEI